MRCLLPTEYVDILTHFADEKATAQGFTYLVSQLVTSGVRLLTQMLCGRACTF